MIDLKIIGYYHDMRFRVKRDHANFKKMSIFSHDHMIIASEEGLHYLDLNNQEKEPLLISAKDLIVKSDKTKFFKNIENFTVCQIPFTQRQLMRIRYTSTLKRQDG